MFCLFAKIFHIFVIYTRRFSFRIIVFVVLSCLRTACDFKLYNIVLHSHTHYFDCEIIHCELNDSTREYIITTKMLLYYS